MNLFLKEEIFCAYLENEYPGYNFELGHSVISINIINFNPVMSCVYISDNLVAAARYQRHLKVFTDKLIFNKEQLLKTECIAKGSRGQILIHTKEKLENGSNLMLTLNVSTLTGTKWHKNNLKNIISKYSQ